MNSRLKKLSAILGVGLMALGARAGLTFSDNFDEYTLGGLTNQTPVWVAHSGINPINIVADPTGPGNDLQVSQALAQDVHALVDTNGLFTDLTVTNVSGGVTNINFAYTPSNSVNALYVSMKLYVTTVPTVTPGNQTYFTHFYTPSGSFVGKMFITTNGITTPGDYRIAVQNASSTPTNFNSVDLAPNTAYTVVGRFLLASGTESLWIVPSGSSLSETSTISAVGLDVPTSLNNVMAYAFRQAGGEGVIDVDNLRLGTTFSDVVPGSVNPPTFVSQPQDTNVFSGTTVTFSTLALGDSPLTYQWYTAVSGVTNLISGATSRTVTLSSVTPAQSGIVYCVATDPAGSNTTRSAVLNVSPSPIPPTIDVNTAVSSSPAAAGSTVTISVTAHGLPAPAYQWKFISATNPGVTNIVSGSFATGTNTATLTLSPVTPALSGSYFVTITNTSSVGFMSTNSALATLTVTPPPMLSVAAARSMVDPVSFAPTNTTSLITLQGIVTTWTNMTSSSTSLEFYMQDASGGIAVFWSGAVPTTNLPPAGALVSVTGALNSFSGLLEIEPVFGTANNGVTVISTNNPLPTPQPLIFDPSVAGNMALMKQFESTYFVASNVMLNLSTPAFVSGANDPITNVANATLHAGNSVTNVTFSNGAGQTFILFVGGSTDLPGKTKPTGPVTIYGVLGFFTAQGFEFTPSRFADIISYQHVTNVLVSARQGDAATNSFLENVVRPGDTITTFVSIGDAAGGTVTLTPTGTLPTGAVWSNITSGLTATATLTYTGQVADAGMDFTNQLIVSTTAGTTYTESININVPSAQDQQIAITEFLANPTTNPAAANYNPLQRATEVNAIGTNDQYIEIANISGAPLTSDFSVDMGSPSSTVFDALDGFGASIGAFNALIIYGGNGTNNIPPGIANTALSRGLALQNGSVIELRDNGLLIDRVVYNASQFNTNGSLSRFPTINSGFVPQPYISTNTVTPGLQYDGSPWTAPAKIPTGVTGVSISYSNGLSILKFPTPVKQAYTLWDAPTVTSPFNVIFGLPYSGSTGTLTNANTASQQFYFITTQ